LMVATLHLPTAQNHKITDIPFLHKFRRQLVHYLLIAILESQNLFNLQSQYTKWTNLPCTNLLHVCHPSKHTNFAAMARCSQREVILCRVIHSNRGHTLY
jgi:hypothetical protein